MTDKDFFVEIIKSELPRFERVLKAVESIPKSKHSYKHDARSRSTAELIMSTFAIEGGMFMAILKVGKLDFTAWPAPKAKTIEDVRKEFVKGLKAAANYAAKMSQKDWQKKTQMFMAGKMVWEDKRGKIAWEFLFDLIHHRGQLSTHLRPMGGKVPSIYGPSADSEK